MLQYYISTLIQNIYASIYLAELLEYARNVPPPMHYFILAM